MISGVDAALDAIASDRVHDGAYLARKALGVLALTAEEQRAGMLARLMSVRGDLPAIRAALEEATRSGDARATIRRADAERRRIARSAARSLHRRRVATLSNSTLVARALVYGGPAVTQVVVRGAQDEGWRLAFDLRAAGLQVEVVRPDAVEADLAIVGCEAVFANGTFIARRGTAALVELLPTLVLADRWTRIDSGPPPALSSPRRYELVRGDRVQAPA